MLVGLSIERESEGNQNKTSDISASNYWKIGKLWRNLLFFWANVRTYFTMDKKELLGYWMRYVYNEIMLIISLFAWGKYVHKKKVKVMNATIPHSTYFNFNLQPTNQTMFYKIRFIFLNNQVALMVPINQQRRKHTVTSRRWIFAWHLFEYFVHIGSFMCIGGCTVIAGVFMRVWERIHDNCQGSCFPSDPLTHKYWSRALHALEPY